MLRTAEEAKLRLPLRYAAIPEFRRSPRRFLWHRLPAREAVTARMAVPHFGCGTAALCLRGESSLSHEHEVPAFFQEGKPR